MIVCKYTYYLQFTSESSSSSATKVSISNSASAPKNPKYHYSVKAIDPRKGFEIKELRNQDKLVSF